MATGNFHNENASRIFTLSDDGFYDELPEDLSEGLKELAEKNKLDFSAKGKDQDELRSYPSKVLGELYKFKHYNLPNYGVMTVEVNIVSILRTGYYEGANLDWTVNILFDGDNIDIEYVADQLEYLNDKPQPHKAKQITSWIEKQKEILINILEDHYTRISEPLTVAARFSNGETIYQKA